MASPLIPALTQDNFDKEVLQSTTLCPRGFLGRMVRSVQKSIAPLLDELADEYDGKVKIGGKVNIDEQQALATKYGNRAIPTLLLINKGEVAEQMVGAKSKRDLKASLDRVAV